MLHSFKTFKHLSIFGKGNLLASSDREKRLGLVVGLRLFALVRGTFLLKFLQSIKQLSGVLSTSTPLEGHFAYHVLPTMMGRLQRGTVVCKFYSILVSSFQCTLHSNQFSLGRFGVVFNVSFQKLGRNKAPSSISMNFADCVYTSLVVGAFLFVLGRRWLRLLPLVNIVGKNEHILMKRRDEFKSKFIQIE
jgi:hypothetical protein